MVATQVEGRFLRAFGYLSDWARQLITIASAILVLGIALLKDVVRSAGPSVPWVNVGLLVSYLLLFAAVWMALKFMRLTGEAVLITSSELPAGDTLRVLRSHQGWAQGLFFGGLVVFAVVALLAVGSWKGIEEQKGAPAGLAAGTVAVPATASLTIKYVRDSAEYSALADQVYRIAGGAVERAPKPAAPVGWAVVLDVDETALDNSTYQLERACYGVPFSPASWVAWAKRVEAPAVPGVKDFISRVRRLSGARIAWITDRESSADSALDLTKSTRSNLAKVGLWDEKDLLCMRAGNSKRERRHELETGRGACSWPGTPIEPVLFVGDQLGDFPEPGELWFNAEETFGRRFFILPQPMYGRWVTDVTRPDIR